MFFSSNPSKLARQQLDHAKRALLEHQEAAEFNVAMANMLKERIARLQAGFPVLTSVVAVTNQGSN